uniref:Uncharacterized protein n=1 Tax=Anguilla anguilla TaxID=7936 RepID=A0A0E9X643_ANGAN
MQQVKALALHVHLHNIGGGLHVCRGNHLKTSCRGSPGIGAFVLKWTTLLTVAASVVHAQKRVTAHGSRPRVFQYEGVGVSPTLSF